MKHKMIISVSILLSMVLLMIFHIDGESFIAPLGIRRGATGGDAGEQFFHKELGYVEDQPTHNLIAVDEDDNNPKRTDRIPLYNETNPEYIRGYKNGFKKGQDSGYLTGLEKGREIGRRLGHYEAERGIDTQGTK